jgi:hypothetical protein
MNFYYFSGGDHIENNRIRELEKSGFTGVLFKYNTWAGDYLTKIARDIKESEKIIYMVAIRPYAISPQYLNMMSHSIESIMKNRLQFNLISSHVKINETGIGGILGEINDNSTNIEKSNYLIEYMKELSNMKENKTYIHSADFFVTTSNEYVFNTAKLLNQKIIIPYREYKQKYWTKYDNYIEWGVKTQEKDKISYGSKINLENTEVMLSIAPILRETKEELEKVSRRKEGDDNEYFTYNEFNNFIKKLKEKNIQYLMMYPWPFSEEEYIINYVKYFTEKTKI